jgi:hypothetical protein
LASTVYIHALVIDRCCCFDLNDLTPAIALRNVPPCATACRAALTGDTQGSQHWLSRAASAPGHWAPGLVTAVTAQLVHARHVQSKARQGRACEHVLLSLRPGLLPLRKASYAAVSIHL